VDLRAVKTASRQELAECAVAAARNAQDLLGDAELLSGVGRNGPAFSLAVLSIEETGKSMDMSILAALPESFKARAPLRRLLEWHALKLAGGLVLSVLPFGGVASKIAAMGPDEVAQHLSILFGPAEEADRLKRRGVYVDLERGGHISQPSEITEAEVTIQLDLARQAAESVARVILAPGFLAWLADPPPEGLELAEDLVTALTEGGRTKTPQAATKVIVQAVARFRERRGL
jgi:AbiV family abortive infection protein